MVTYLFIDPIEIKIKKLKIKKIDKRKGK